MYSSYTKNSIINIYNVGVFLKRPELKDYDIIGLF